MDKIALGKRIKNERIKRNLTQEQVAELIDVGDVFVGQIERGERTPSITTLIKIANSFGLSTDYILMDEVTAGKSYALNEITEIVKDLSPHNLMLVKDVVSAMVASMESINRARASNDYDMND